MINLVHCLTANKNVLSCTYIVTYKISSKYLSVSLNKAWQCFLDPLTQPCHFLYDYVVLKKPLNVLVLQLLYECKEGMVYVLINSQIILMCSWDFLWFCAKYLRLQLLLATSFLFAKISYTYVTYCIVLHIVLVTLRLLHTYMFYKAPLIPIIYATYVAMNY